MALNREQKRQLKRSGDVGDGEEPTTNGRSSSATPVKAPVAKDKRTPPGQFVREVRSELRKVAWPTRQETLNYSLIVAMTLVIMTSLIFGLDWIFSEAVLRLFNAK